MAKRKNENPSLANPEPETIDLGAIEKLAAEVDMLNKLEETPGKKKRKSKSSPKQLGEDGPGQPETETAAEPLIEPDPEFQFMISHVTSGAIEGIKKKLNWSDPGLQWKEKVGLTVFRLSQRIKPMGDSWLTDVATLVGYVGLWSASNVLFDERASPNPNPVRDNGERKDVQNERTLGPGGESHTL